MAKYKGLSHIYPKDYQALSVLGHSGSISRESLHQLGISDNRIKSYQKSLIKRIEYPEKYGSGSRECFILTKTGTDFLKNECHFDKTISNGESYHHNENVSRWIADNLNKQEIGTLLNERQIRDILEEHLSQYREQGNYERYNELYEKLEQHQLSCPDIAYVSSKTGTLVCVEITTSSYKGDVIEAKELCADEIGAEIQFVSAS